MSNFKTFVERNVLLQLQQYLTRFPIPLFAALEAFSKILVIGHTSSASLSPLATTLGKTLASLNTSEGIQLPNLTSIFHIFTHTLHTACLRTRIHFRIPIQLRDMLHGWAASRAPGDDTYATTRAKAKYWRIAGRYHQRLYSGNGTCMSGRSIPVIPSRESDANNTVIPLVTYYTPRLLPIYRNHSGGGKKRALREADADAQEGRVSPRTFCKWHRMVFQDAYHHPTLVQAAAQIKYYSSRDLREIQRIARLLPDEQVFGSNGKRAWRSKGAMRYREMWQHWLEHKGMDIVIVFE